MNSSKSREEFNERSSVLKSAKLKLTGMYLSNTVNFARSFFSKFLNEQNSGGEIVKQSNFWVRGTILGLMGTTMFGIGWLSVAKTDEIVTVSGKLEPIGSVQEIQMPLGGIASEILVKDGQEVKRQRILSQALKQKVLRLNH